MTTSPPDPFDSFLHFTIFAKEARGLICLCNPIQHSHTLLIVELQSVVLQWDVSGDMVSWFLTDSSHSACLCLHGDLAEMYKRK